MSLQIANPAVVAKFIYALTKARDLPLLFKSEGFADANVPTAMAPG
jgi:hypothetical protein